MISILFANKALEHNKLEITNSDAGSRKFLITCEDSIRLCTCPFRSECNALVERARKYALLIGCDSVCFFNTSG